MRNRQEPIKIIAIVGPTASGKTNAARRLAMEINGEIVSADSRQVYIGLDIGTGKEGVLRQNKTAMADKYPLLRYVGNIPQWLIDIVNPQKHPKERYSVINFQTEATPIILNIANRGKVPIMVGGTGLYVSALLEGYEFQPTQRSLDNPRHASGTATKKNKPNWNTLLLALDPPRKTLYERIDNRVDRRLKEGLIAEGENLLNAGLTAEDLRSFGLEYRFIADLLEKKITNENFTPQLKFAIHAYARRQLTWWRNHGKVQWVNDYDSILDQSKKFLK